MGRGANQKVRLRLLFERDGESHFVDAKTDNISPEGVFITTKRHPLPVGTKVTILLELRDRKKELQIQGAVAWQGEGDPIDPISGSSGMGIVFEDMAEDAREMLFSAIEAFESAEGRGPTV